MDLMALVVVLLITPMTLAVTTIILVVASLGSVSS